MKNLSIMLKPASSACNLRCSYCFYRDVSESRETQSFGKMSLSLMHRVLDNVFCDLTAGDQVTFVFQGGEPTLAGLPFYREFVDCCKAKSSVGADIHYALQTNGILLDEEWCGFLKENDFLTGLSLDGPAAIHNAQRKDVSGKGTFSQVMGAKSLMDQMGVKYNVLMVLTQEMARHPKEIWNFLLENRIGYVQFIPCLDDLDIARNPWALSADRYARFYSELFSFWFAALQKGTYVSIKLFDDYIQLLRSGFCGACGLLGTCSSQIVVEADGSVYPCDFYVLDQYRAGNLGSQTLREVYDSPVMRAFPHREVPQNPQCSSCPYLRICGGGCARMRNQVFVPGKNGVCGHRVFLENALPKMAAIARSLR